MLNDNLVGYEENFYSKIYRSKLLERHYKKIEEINNRKNKFVSNSVDFARNYGKNSKSKNKRKSAFYDPVSEYEKDFSNFILAKRIIDISNRDLQKGTFSRLEANSPFLEMKKAIKKNLDRFKEKQLGVENYNMFKRLSNKQSSLSPNNLKYNKNSEAESDSNSKKQEIKRRKSSSISNLISILNENIEEYKDLNNEGKVINEKKKQKKTNEKTEKGELILPQIKSTIRNPPGDMNVNKLYLNNNYNNLEINLDYKNLKDKISEELDSNHARLKNQSKRIENKSDVNNIKFQEGV